MTLARAAALGALVVAAVVVAAFAGYEIGHSSRDTASDARKARLAAERTAFADARAAGYRRTRSSGYSRGFTEGSKQGAKDGASGSSTITRISGTPGNCGAGHYTNTAGRCVPYPSGYGAPPANSPEGKKIIQTDPSCHNPPPPPNYKGPVQCNKP